MFKGQSLHLWRSRLVAAKWNLAPGALDYISGDQ